MSRRYELTDQELGKNYSIASAEKTGKPRRPAKENRQMINAMVWIVCSGAPWRDLPECYRPWKSVYSPFRKWIDDGILNHWMPPLFRLTNIVQVQKKICK